MLKFLFIVKIESFFQLLDWNVFSAPQRRLETAQFSQASLKCESPSDDISQYLKIISIAIFFFSIQNIPSNKLVVFTLKCLQVYTCFCLFY